VKATQGFASCFLVLFGVCKQELQKHNRERKPMSHKKSERRKELDRRRRRREKTKKLQAKERAKQSGR